MLGMTDDDRALARQLVETEAIAWQAFRNGALLGLVLGSIGGIALTLQWLARS